MKLYELTAQFTELSDYLDQVEQGTQEDPDQLFQLLARMEGDIVDKIENITRYVLSLQADAASIEAEQTRLQLRRKSTENKVAWLKEYMMGQMQAAGLDKVQKAIMTVSIRKSPASVQVLDEAEIPAQFKIVETAVRIDKKAILVSYKKDGELVPGTYVIADKKYLHIS